MILPAVPDLPAMVKPSIRAWVPVPRATTSSMIEVSSAAVRAVIGRPTSAGTIGVRTPSLTMARTTRGCSSRPPLATALAAAAICSGVTPT